MSERVPDIDLLTEAETAQLLRVSRRHLQRLVQLGEGPPRVILGERRVAYHRAGVVAWVAARTHVAAASHGTAVYGESRLSARQIIRMGKQS